MKKTIVRISIVLLLIVALPLTFFMVKQASNLTENEEIVQRVFDKQLETILYTINQNSENLIVSWISQIDLPIPISGELMQKVTATIFQNNTAVQQIDFFNLADQKNIASYSPDIIKATNVNWPNSVDLDRMNEFLKNNYQKIETVRDNDLVHLYFLLKSADGSVLGSISIHSNTFVDQNLRPGIQQISQDRFNISIYDSLNVSTDLLSDSISRIKQNIHQQKMWYLPGYSIYIGLQTATISELVSSRSKIDNSIFYGMLLIVLIGITFVIISIRKEMRLAEMKSEFVSNVSHEIRTPLALISMYTETLLLKRVKTEVKREEYLNIIYHETTRLSAMVNRILSFSKMEKGKRTYQFTNLNIHELIDEVVRHFQPHFIAENVNCQLSLLEDDCVVFADKEAIIEALINLIENAVKYGNEHSKVIIIRTRLSDDNVIVDIEDNGIGIAHKHLKYIFDKFYRVTQGNLAHKAKGSGIGLNIVKQIMIQHNGKIAVKSKEGEGSCFSLIFKKTPKKLWQKY